MPETKLSLEHRSLGGQGTGDMGVEQGLKPCFLFVGSRRAVIPKKSHSQRWQLLF